MSAIRNQFSRYVFRISRRDQQLCITFECSGSKGLRASFLSSYAKDYAGQDAGITTETLIAATFCYRLVFFVFRHFLFLVPFNSFFSSPSSFRCSFFTSSAGGRFSGTIPLFVSIFLTARLLSICSFPIFI